MEALIGREDVTEGTGDGCATDRHAMRLVAFPRGEAVADPPMASSIARSIELSGPDDVGAQQLVEHDVAGGVRRLFSAEHDRAVESELVGRRRRHSAVVTLVVRHQ